MDGLTSWSNAIQQLTGTSEKETPNFSTCPVSDAASVALDKSKQQNKELVAMAEREEAVDEMVDYFADKICKEFNQPDFVKAWKLYKEAYDVK